MINISYQPDPDTLRASQGWGRCMLTIEQRAFWHDGTAQTAAPLLWTWVDLLDHLGRYWLDIHTEADWTHDRMASAMREGKDFWALAEEDWANMPAQVADKEEDQLLQFIRPRNLAHALQGLNLPALYCYRQGTDMLICPEGKPPLHIKCHNFAQMLEKLGDQIDQGIGQTTHSRAQDAQRNWRNRNLKTKNCDKPRSLLGRAQNNRDLTPINCAIAHDQQPQQSAGQGVNHEAR